MLHSMITPPTLFTTLNDYTTYIVYHTQWLHHLHCLPHSMITPPTLFTTLNDYTTYIVYHTQWLHHLHCLPHSMITPPTLFTTLNDYTTYIVYHTQWLHHLHCLPHSMITPPTLFTTLNDYTTYIVCSYIISDNTIIIWIMLSTYMTMQKKNLVKLLLSAISCIIYHVHVGVVVVVILW